MIVPIATLVNQVGALLFSVDNRAHIRKKTEKSVLPSYDQLKCHLIQRYFCTVYDHAGKVHPVARAVKIRKENCG